MSSSLPQLVIYAALLGPTAVGFAPQDAKPPLPAPAPAASAAALDVRAPWPCFRGDAALRGIASGAITSSSELLWSYPTAGAVASSPVVAGGIVYVGSDDQKLHAVRVADGTPLWSAPTGDIIEAPPLYVDGVVVVGSHDGNAYAFDAASGEPRWKLETGDKIVGSANALRSADGKGWWVVVGSYDATVTCVEARTGVKQWSYTTANYINGAPAIDGDLVVFGGCDAVLHAVDAKTGEKRLGLEIGQECFVTGSVALDAGRAYFGHYGNELVCVDLAKEEIVWRYPSLVDQAFVSSPAVGADHLVVGGRDKHLHCLAKSDGKLLWKVPTRRKIDGCPVICGDKVVFGSGDGRLFVVRLADGEVLWTYDLGSSIFSSPAVADGRIYVGAADKRLHCFGVR
jgi:outer membrane protein assembly factor BamB